MNAFSDQLNPIQELVKSSGFRGTSIAQVRRVIARDSLDYRDFLCLLSPAAADCLDAMEARARLIVLNQHGRNVTLYAPLYLSNECENSCRYCAFRRENPAARSTLGPGELESELAAVKAMGIRNLLLVSGESRSAVPPEALAKALERCRCHGLFPSLEVYPLSEDDYRRMVAAGAQAVTLYQESYLAGPYAHWHPEGRKADFAWRLAAPERALAAGVRRFNLGVLLGLADWRDDIALLGAHAAYLGRRFWRSELGLGFPRLRDFPSSDDARRELSEAELLQLILALRLYLPGIAMSLSTRESPAFRNRALGLVTLMSAASSTRPGGYARGEGEGVAQFATHDRRTLAEVLAAWRARGYYPLHKDWTPEWEGVDYASMGQ